MKTLLGSKICILYWRIYVQNGCAIAGFYCIQIALTPNSVPEANQSGFRGTPILSALTESILLELKMIGQGAGVGEVDAQRIRHFTPLTGSGVERQRRPVTHPNPYTK